MKKPDLTILLFILTFFLSCEQHEDLSPVSSSFEKITRITLKDGNGLVQDTLTFNYLAEKISSVDWCTTMPHVNGSSCLVGYSESRYYSDDNTLDSISGRWTASYKYENNLREKIVAYKDNQYYSTTTLLEYNNAYPNRIKVEYAASEVMYIDLTINSSGDLIRKTIEDTNGVLLADTQIEYTNIKNPLQGLMETPSYAVLFFGFDDLVFYYSTHVPETVTTYQGPNSHIAPVNQVIRYENKLDPSGRLISAKAFREQFNMHNLLIEYEQ